MRISRPLRDWSFWPIGPSTGSALYLCSHPVQLVCAEPYWAIIRPSLRDFTLQTAVATPGLERNASSTELCACDPALDQQSGKAGTNVGTPERVRPRRAVPFNLPSFLRRLAAKRPSPEN